MLDHSSVTKEVVRLTQELVRIKSINPPGDELPAAELLADRLQTFGLEADVVTVDKNRANVIAILKGSGDASSIMFNGHLDVVPLGELASWERDPFCGDIVDGKVFGRGSTDMKGGIAAMSVAAGLVAAKSIKGNLLVVAVSGEETDSIGARHYIQHNSLDGLDGVVIPEPTSLDLVIAEKGTLWLELTTYGKTAHSTQPHVGVNAVEHMIQLLKEVKDTWEGISYSKDRYLSPPTINIATISGGVKTNSIPDKCVATVDLRPIPSQSHAAILDNLRKKLSELTKKVPNFKADMKVINERQPVATDPESKLVRKAKTLGPALIGKELELMGANYYTDAAIFATKRKIPTVVLGPGEMDLRRNIYLGHQPNEYVRIENLEKAARFYFELAKSMLQ